MELIAGINRVIRIPRWTQSKTISFRFRKVSSRTAYFRDSLGASTARVNAWLAFGRSTSTREVDLMVNLLIILRTVLSRRPMEFTTGMSLIGIKCSRNRLLTIIFKIMTRIIEIDCTLQSRVCSHYTVNKQ